MAGVALFKKPRQAATRPQGTAPEKGPPTDPLVGDAAAHRFRTELAAGRWQEFHDFLEATRDWDSRDFYVSKLSALDERPAWLEEWTAARPGSSLPWLFRGHQGVHWAWRARGGGRAHTVGEDAWPVFYARLVEADRDLARAASLDDEDPTPHAESIRVAIGLQLGPAEKQQRFAEAVRRFRWHQSAHMATVQATAAKWGGSEKEMFDFARRASAQAPEGSSVHATVPMAHLEQWLSLPSKSADGQPVDLLYIRNGQVRAEIWRAADRSVRSPRYQPSRFTPADRNIFAMCFYLMRDYQAQLDQMRLIGPHVTASPWNYQGDPGFAYERARTQAMEAIGIPQPAAQGPGPYRTP
jgi:hypothetical protein